MAEEQNKTSSSSTQMEQLTPSAGSYLYLHPSENPATSLVSPLLEPSNYHSWSRSMLTALSVKNKIELVLGMHPCPAKDHSSYPSWYKCNNMVTSWLVHFVSIPIRQSIVWMEKALDIWNDLKVRYSQDNLSWVSDLQFEAASLNQGDLFVTNYFTKLMII